MKPLILLMQILLLVACTSPNELSVSSESESMQPVDYEVIETALPKFVHVYAAFDNNLIIDDEANLWAWGDNTVGQINPYTTEEVLAPIKILDNVMDAKCGYMFMCALKTDQSLWLWGANDKGQLGTGDNRNSKEPMKILENVTSFDAGRSFCMAVTDDGSLWVWGLYMDRTIVKPEKIMEGIESVTVGHGNYFVLTSGRELWGWGINTSGLIPSEESEIVWEPVFIMNDVMQIKSRRSHCLALQENGEVWSWGKADYGYLGIPEDELIFNHNYPPRKVLADVKEIGVGFSDSLAIKNDDTLWIWGSTVISEDGQHPDLYGPGNYEPVYAMDHVISASTGIFSVNCITDDGVLWTWGSIGLGKGDYKSSYKPSPIEKVYEVKVVA